ncbi:phytanoyl-CoA dioxygenase family protein [uncultured Chitinophaga sp.]|jgi:Phytanoyl-CoA dioxygenase (PhyH).|uniref:phytanoyl-CoA dioxygenase family protein n=1 Tax=uncultured Chitinophaga sp. TaxID=339340 RepID=UPI00262548C2|nr:phytanoyl-CoA dioxygenase family protein [uncultured Chitinophaga sp.]
MKEVFNNTQIDHFIHKGFIRIDQAFDAQLAAAARDILWKDMDADPDNPATWTKPVIWLGMYSAPPFVAAANTPVLHGAFDQLVGKGNWLPCGSMGAFPVRFPATADTGDTGWHVDASFPGNDPGDAWRINWRSKGRALLMLFLFSDVGEQDAPTVIREGSHLDVARLLKDEGEAGLTFMDLAMKLPSLPERKEVLATGQAGTVYLCHPFLVHRAQVNRGAAPRFLAQPPLLLKHVLQPEGDKAQLSPVAAAIRLGTDGVL